MKSVKNAKRRTSGIRMSGNEGRQTMQMDLKRFEYTPFSFNPVRWFSSVLEFEFCGIAGDYVFEILRRSETFYECDLLEFLWKNYGGQLDVILDVGANIGNHTVFFGKILQADVHSFEPQEAVRGLLRQNIAANDLECCCEVHPFALGN